MDLTDTWIKFADFSKAERRRRSAGAPHFTLTCGICGAEVETDDDFDIYSTHHAVIENSVDDRPVPQGPFSDLAMEAPRLVDEQIICLPCAKRNVPELASLVERYRQLRAQRAEALENAH